MHTNRPMKLLEKNPPNKYRKSAEDRKNRCENVTTGCFRGRWIALGSNSESKSILPEGSPTPAAAGVVVGREVDIEERERCYFSKSQDLRDSFTYL